MKFHSFAVGSHPEAVGNQSYNFIEPPLKFEMTVIVQPFFFFQG